MNNDPNGTTRTFLFYEYRFVEIREPAVLMNEAAVGRDVSVRHHATSRLSGKFAIAVLRFDSSTAT